MTRPPEVARVVAEFPCPFCGGQAAAIEPAGVIHNVPECAKFAALGVVEYLAAVNAVCAVVGAAGLVS